MTDAADRLDEWVRGWCASRATAEPTAVPGGWHVAVGDAADRERTFLRSAEHLAAAAARPASPPSRIACLHPLDEALPPPPANWTIWPPDWFMVGPAPERVTTEPPPGYRAVVRDEEARALVEIRTHLHAGDELAASGQVGVHDGVAVPDRVETEAAYRRRGLGRVLMAVLATAAAERGARASVISASADGRALYESLGWTGIARFPSFVRAS